MPTINGKVCVVNGVPVDKVFSNGKQIYGRNIITKTSADLQTSPYSHSNSTGGFIHYFISDELIHLAGNKVTTRTFIHNTTTHTVNLVMWTNYGGVSVGTDVLAGTDGYSTITNYSIASNSDTWGNITIRAYADNAEINGVPYKEFKLEKGSVVTPWSPAPEDVLNGYIAAPRNLKETVIDLNSVKLDWE